MPQLSRRTLLRASALTACAAALPAMAQQKPAAAPAESANPQLDDLKAAFQQSRAYTLEVAQAMPEEKYNFRPVPEVRSFGQQMVHIGESLRAIYETFMEMKEKPTFTFSEAGKEVFASKAEVVGKLEQCYQYVQDAIAKLDDAALAKPAKFFGGRTIPARRLLRILLDHSTHHRGQAVTYLRMQGIKPPAYRG